MEAPCKLNWNLEVSGFVEGGKPEKNPQIKARTNNKLNPHETASTRIEPGSQRWEASAYPLRQPCYRLLSTSRNKQQSLYSNILLVEAPTPSRRATSKGSSGPRPDDNFLDSVVQLDFSRKSTVSCKDFNNGLINATVNLLYQNRQNCIPFIPISY